MNTRQDRQYYIYLITNSVRTLYVGVTNDFAPNLSLRSPPPVIPSEARNLKYMNTRQDRQYYVYLMTNSLRTLYAGVTKDMAPPLSFRVKRGI